MRRAGYKLEESQTGLFNSFGDGMTQRWRRVINAIADEGKKRRRDWRLDSWMDFDSKFDQLNL